MLLTMTPNWIKKQLARFMSDETGATPIEYGVVAAGVMVALLVVVARRAIAQAQ